MRFFITDPTVHYAGKTLPKDAAAPYTPPGISSVNYANKVLPKDAVTPTPFKDTVNTPGYCNIGGVILPPDVLITPINGKKALVATEILDGPTAFERILTKATKIEFDCVLRMYTQGGANFNGTVSNAGRGPGPAFDIFAQEYLHQVWFNLFQPNSVLQVQNSVLNNLNISQLIIEEIDVALVRGSTNIPVKIHAWENVVGQSLIIQTIPGS